MFFHPETPPGGQPPNSRQSSDSIYPGAAAVPFKVRLLSLLGDFLDLIFRPKEKHHPVPHPSHPQFFPSSEGNLHCDNVRDTVKE